MAKRWARRVSVVILLMVLAGCATAGRNFNVPAVQEITMGETSKADIARLFGAPWRTGVEDGRETWTYGHYKYSLFGETKTRDLVLRFDGKGKVASYTFNSTYPEDRRF